MIKTVLVVDDDQGDRALIKEYLVEVDSTLKFIMAESGQQGIEEVKKRRPDLVVVDVMMPGMDGFETSCAIKAIDETIKVIILTGAVETFDESVREVARAEIYTTKNIMDLTLAKAFLKLRA